MYIIDKKITEKPHENLAYEQCLMDAICDKKVQGPILFLWQNDDTVVIGRNQSIYKECNLSYIANENINVVRRLTGGGAVYHDNGNLNYSYIDVEEAYNRSKVFEIICKALERLGIKCVTSGRNDLVVGESKISGTAFFNRAGIVLHHGTIMIDVNISRMSKCLTPNKAKLRSKGIHSVSSRVINLKDLCPCITVDMVKQVIIDEFVNCYGKTEEEIAVNQKQYEYYMKQFSSKEFLMGTFSPKHESISKIFPWGILELNFAIENNIVEECIAVSDMLYPDLLDKVVKCIQNTTLQDWKEKKINVLCAVQNETERHIVQDIFDWLEESCIDESNNDNL